MPTSFPTIPAAAWTRRMDAELAEPGRPVKEGLRDGGWLQGLPLGGFGTGGIGRSFLGSFGRWTVKAGNLKHFCEPVNAFSVYQAREGKPGHAVVLHPGYPRAHPEDPVPDEPELAAWNWNYPAAAGTYHALFPKAWFHYAATPEWPVEMVCEQFSPVLPEQYRETSLPVGVFRWFLRNPSAAPATVSIAFSFTNMVGWFNDFSTGRPGDLRGAGAFNTCRSGKGEDGSSVAGVVFDRTRLPGRPREGDGQLCIAAAGGKEVELFATAGFDPHGDGAEIWDTFSRDGSLPTVERSLVCETLQDVAGAVAARVTVPAGGEACLTLALAWDLPIIAFGSGREHRRRYTEYVGCEGNQAWPLACEALAQGAAWSARIDDWHHEVMARQERPAWLNGLLFNELYLLVDGFTVWTAPEEGEGGAPEHFGIIECPDYPFYCTLDLWTYGSFVLLDHWPALERLVVRHFAALVEAESTEQRLWLWKGEPFQRKRAGAVPHDFGEPRDDAFHTCNSYSWQNTNLWKDLNPGFVLLVCRDWVSLQDDELLAACWPAVKAALAYLMEHDRDGDGLLEHGDAPDQTFDNVVLSGASAYSASLWMGALAAGAKMATALGEADRAGEYSQLLAKAQTAMEAKLWAGTHYRLDTGGENTEALFLEQLFGIWYAALCGLGDLLPAGRMRTALKTLHDHNFVQSPTPARGAVNLFAAEVVQSSDRETLFNPEQSQVREMLSGINISFACQLLTAGLEAEALAVLEAVYRTIYEEKGLWFRTPAAWNERGDFRAIMNLRPLVVWALACPRGERPQ